MKTSSFFHVLHFKMVIKKEQFKGKGHENSYGRGQLLFWVGSSEGLPVPRLLEKSWIKKDVQSHILKTTHSGTSGESSEYHFRRGW